jgi:prepilin-type N-terminal cleavage/methylation domain-containing protein
MNRKGFTLIELLAVIVLLGLVLVFTVPNIVETYKNSKLKTEKVFADKLSDVIDGHIKLNSSNFNFLQDGTATKEGIEGTVTIYKDVITINKIIEGKLISESDYINAGNKDVKCNINAEVEVYKDSDYVYCHKVKKESLGCLTKEYKDSITGNYVIDTCVWSR